MAFTRETPYRVLSLVASMLLVCGCQKSLPTAPSGTAEGLIIYEHDNFRGKSGYVTEDIPDLEKFTGPCTKSEVVTLPNGSTVTNSVDSWDNCVSSIRLAAGWRATLYGDAHYRGSNLEVTGDIADLRSVAGSCAEGFNDCVSSIRVFRP